MRQKALEAWLQACDEGRTIEAAALLEEKRRLDNEIRRRLSKTKEIY